MSSALPVTFVAWTSRDGRAGEIAQAMGGEPYTVFPKILSSRRLTPLRYLVSAVATLAHLMRVRPALVIVTNPPVFAGCAVALFSKLTGTPFILDSHPTAFGAKNHRISQRLMPIHRFLARRAVTTMVTTQEWVDVVAQWGASADIVHEAPHAAFVPLEAVDNERAKVLFVGIYASDEPISEVIVAAQLAPEVDFAITGDVARCPEGLRQAANSISNVFLTGYLRGEEYERALGRADVILALTTEPTSVMRAAYEAVYSRKPLVISDTPTLRGLFAHAVFVTNSAESIAAGIREAIGNKEMLLKRAGDAVIEQQSRWDSQFSALRSRLRS